MHEGRVDRHHERGLVVAGVPPILAEHLPAVVVSTRGTHVVEGMPMSWRTRDAIVGEACAVAQGVQVGLEDALSVVLELEFLFQLPRSYRLRGVTK